MLRHHYYLTKYVMVSSQRIKAISEAIKIIRLVEHQGNNNDINCQLKHLESESNWKFFHLNTPKQHEVRLTVM